MCTAHTLRPFVSKGPRVRAAACLVMLSLAWLSTPDIAFSQQTAPAERVRVPTSYANVQMTPSSGAQILVLAPKGTVLTVVARDKEWIQVQLTPDLRKTGMVMRWYKNEDKGWMHDSTVEVVKAP